MLQDGRRTPAHRAAIAILIGLAVGLTTTPARAAGTGGAFIIGPDEDAYRLSQTELLAADVRKALIDAASANRREIDSVGEADTVSVYIKDDARTPDIVAAVRNHFAGRSDLVVSVSPAEVDRISFALQVLASTSLDARMRDSQYLERFVRDARGDLQGIDIARDVEGVVVRINDPTRNAEFAAVIRNRFLKGGWLMASAPDHSWRITIDPAVFNAAASAGPNLKPLFGAIALSPARRLLAPEAIEYELRDYFREPRDLRTNTSPNGLVVLIHDPKRYPAFTTKLKQVFSSNADFVFAVSPAQLLTVSLTASGSPSNLAPGAGGAPNDLPAALSTAWGEVNDLIDPPAPEIETRPIQNGLEIRTRDSAHAADVATTIRHHFANNQDFVVETQADQSLRVIFSNGYLASRIPAPSVLAENIRACLHTWKLDASHVSVADAKRMAVDFASDNDANKFRELAFNQCGFMMRMVDKEAGPDPTERPPSPGDERFPQAASEPFSFGPGLASFPSTQNRPLWLKSGVLITADMIQEAHADLDQNGRPSISFKFNDEGRQRFAAITTANVGQRFAIVSDGVVLSAPVIMTPITAGQGQITGNFTAESAQALASSIVASKPPFPLKIIEEHAGIH